MATTHTAPTHPSGIHERIVAKVSARRGRLHAYERLDPTRTALAVIDMVEASVANDPQCAATVPAINRMAAALRGAGGTVAFVRPRPTEAFDPALARVVGEARARHFHQEAHTDNPRSAFHRDLDIAPGDVRVEKDGFSAFFPGKCDLDAQLRARGIDMVLVAGTVTNVCCEASARDAVELGYKVVMVSDALTGHAFGLHEASLATFYRIYGDVRPADEVVALLQAGAGAEAGTEAEGASQGHGG